MRQVVEGPLELYQTCPVMNEDVPYKDWYPIIKTRIREKWTDEWRAVQGNKLRMLTDTPEIANSYTPDNRLHSIILTRLKIGHTKITHQYLMESSQQPYCEDCIVPLTVKHLMAECPSFGDIRLRVYPQSHDLDPTQLMKLMLFGLPNDQFSLASLLEYLRETRLLNEIV